MNFTKEGDTLYGSVSVADGQSVVVELPASAKRGLVGVHPGAGASATLQATISQRAEIKADQAKWASTNITAATVSVIDEVPAGVNALKLYSTGGITVFQIAQ